MKRYKRHKPVMGSVSSGTLITQELIGTFADELRYLRGALPKQIVQGIAAIGRGDCEAEDVLQELMDALQEFAPPYFYFGAHPGDGSDFGFWLSEYVDSDFEGLKVSDTSEVPKSYRGEVLHINERGNMTLYIARATGLKEVWAVV